MNKEMNNTRTKKNEKHLLKEYDKVTSFYQNDDKIGTDLVSFGTLINSGLISVVALLFTSSLELAFRYLLVSLFAVAGIAANLELFLRQCRINLYMEAWMLKGRHVENELKKRGYDFDIFETQRMIQDEKKFKYIKDDKTETRVLGLWERSGGHRLSKHTWAFLVFLWGEISLLCFIFFHCVSSGLTL
jgi:hypothetical protein